MSIARVPADCAAPGCTKPSRARKLCWAHYYKERRASHGATSRELDPDPRIRIAARSVVVGSGCWEWQKTLDRDGYGVTDYGGAHVRAHRLSYEAFVGQIPEDWTIDHLCRNRACVNPAHLEAVTNAENIRRAVPFRGALTPESQGLADYQGVD